MNEIQTHISSIGRGGIPPVVVRPICQTNCNPSTAYNLTISGVSPFLGRKENLASSPKDIYGSTLSFLGRNKVKYQAGRGAVVSLGLAVYSLDSELLTDSVGKEVLLRAKSSQVLAFLIANAGQLVSRDAIFDTVWAGLEVSDDSLTQCISGIRRAIGDREHKVLQTVSKRGYILNVKVPEHQQSTSTDARALSTRHIPNPSHHNLTSEATCLFATASDQQLTELLHQLDQSKPEEIRVTRYDNGISIWFPNPDIALNRLFSIADLGVCTIGLACGPETAEDEARALSILSTSGAVSVSLGIRDASLTDPRLNFEDLGEHISHQGGGVQNQPIRAFRASRDQSGSGFGSLKGDVLPTLAILPLRNSMDPNAGGPLGLLFANSVTHELSRSHEVNVISSMSTATFARSDLGLTDVRRLLNADFVLSGFWTEHGDVVRFDYEFSDARTQRILWTDSITTTQAEVLGNFDAPHLVAGQIRKAIVLNETLKVQSSPLGSLEAYSVLYGAIGLMHRFSPADFKQSKHLLEELTQSRNHHPTPLAWTARWHLLRVVQGWSDDPLKDSEQAFECTARALDIDPTHTLALVSEGQVLTHLNRRLDEAEHRYDTALEVNPNDANGRMSKAMLLAFVDRGAEGINDAKRSLELSPLDPHRFLNLAMAAGVNLSAGDNDTAVDLARASYKLNRTHTSTLRMLAVAEQRSGNLELAKKAAGELLQLQPDLRVSKWLLNSPSASFANGKEFASDLRSLGVPD